MTLLVVFFRLGRDEWNPYFLKGESGEGIEAALL